MQERCMQLTLIQALDRGVSAHKAGNLQEAERIYKAILQSQPNHPDANHNLGVLAVSVSKVDAAIPLFKKAVEANPKIEQFWLSYADALIKLNQIDNAREVLRRGKANGLNGDNVNDLEMELKERGDFPVSVDEPLTQLIQLFNLNKMSEVLVLGGELQDEFSENSIFR